jgi:putative endonuclease
MSNKPSQSSTERGQYGEEIALQYLKKQKFKVLHQNFKTPSYEIDIIAKKRRRLYFIEVKYRSTTAYGRGHEYVTPQKLDQMTYAAERWVAEHDFRGEHQLGVISVDEDEATLFLDIWT